MVKPVYVFKGVIQRGGTDPDDARFPIVYYDALFCETLLNVLSALAKI
jgi:hypothetical protein